MKVWWLDSATKVEETEEMIDGILVKTTRIISYEPVITDETKASALFQFHYRGKLAK